MRTCSECGRCEVHGYPPEGAPDWYAFTAYLWCPVRNRHVDSTVRACDEFAEGEPKVVRDDADW